ncbi:hypothetical protein O3S80_49235 [Streptomyces sp. Lzd4kr]|nr:hypothetical protein [Streptomyces sp. Lzd4kr]
MSAHCKGVTTTHTHPKDYPPHRLLTTKEAAQLATHWRALHSAGKATVSEAAIRQWRHRGHLTPHDLDHHGRALYHRDALADAERAARDIALNPQLATRTRRPAGTH